MGQFADVGNHGYLIDWDLAKPTNVETPRRVTRTVHGAPFFVFTF